MSELQANPYHDAISIKEEDVPKVAEIQSGVEDLRRHRQEIGRLYQAMARLTEATDNIERDTAEKRRALAHEYNLEKHGSSQWAIDFEKNEFVKLMPDAPVIP